MNKEQRKFAVNALQEASKRKAQIIKDECKKAKATLQAASHPAKLYLAELAKNDKERKVLADRIAADLQALTSFSCWDPGISIALVEDTRISPSASVETPMMKKLKKAYYDELDRLDAVCQERLDKMQARLHALITQIWLSDMPQELVDMLKAFESEEF